MEVQMLIIFKIDSSNPKPIAIWAHVHVKKQRKAQFSNIIAACFNGLVMELQLSLSRSKFETHLSKFYHKFPSWG